MRRLIWGFAGHTYHIVGNLMSPLIYFLLPTLKQLSGYIAFGLFEVRWWVVYLITFREISKILLSKLCYYPYGHAMDWANSVSPNNFTSQDLNWAWYEGFSKNNVICSLFRGNRAIYAQNHLVSIEWSLALDTGKYLIHTFTGLGTV